MTYKTDCPDCGTVAYSPLGPPRCPICPLGPIPVQRIVPPRLPFEVRAVRALGIAMRRIGTAARRRASPRALCPDCYHRKPRCICGSLDQIHWFGDTG